MNRSFNFSDSNVNVTMRYDELQRLLKECVTTTMKEYNNEKKKMDCQKWFDTSQTAQLFGVHVSTINRWKHSGFLGTPRTVGKRDFFSKDEIDKLLKTN